MAIHSKIFYYLRLIIMWVLNTFDKSKVWASPFSLAATNGIPRGLFSSGYLDVSVLRVPSLQSRVLDYY
jgi:hypothetical protein